MNPVTQKNPELVNKIEEKPAPKKANSDGKSSSYVDQYRQKEGNGGQQTCRSSSSGGTTSIGCLREPQKKIKLRLARYFDGALK